MNDDPQLREWMGTVQDGTPDGPKLHSVIVDPRDASHLLFAMSGGGVHESRDAGRSWATLIKGMEVVEGFDAAKRRLDDIAERLKGSAKAERGRRRPAQIERED